jgi:hypothetical protein
LAVIVPQSQFARLRRKGVAAIQLHDDQARPLRRDGT